MVTALNESGHELAMHLLGVGGILDALDIFLQKPCYSVSAKALTDAVITFIKPDVLHQRLATEPLLMLKLWRQVCAQMRALEERYSRLQSHDVSNRLLHALLDLAQCCEPPPGNKAVLPMRLTRSCLAKMVGTTPETISRVMASLRKRRLVLHSAQRITIPDVQRLRETAQRRVLNEASVVS